MNRIQTNILALKKSGENFVFIFDDDQGDEYLRTLGRWASNPDINFSWYDAAVMSLRYRKMQGAKA